MDDWLDTRKINQQVIRVTLEDVVSMYITF